MYTVVIMWYAAITSHILPGLLNNGKQGILPLIPEEALNVCLPYRLYRLQSLHCIQTVQLLGESGDVKPL